MPRHTENGLKKLLFLKDTYPKDTSTHLDICISLCGPSPQQILCYIFRCCIYFFFTPPHPTPLAKRSLKLCSHQPGFAITFQASSSKPKDLSSLRLASNVSQLSTTEALSEGDEALGASHKANGPGAGHVEARLWLDEERLGGFETLITSNTDLIFSASTKLAFR